MYSPIIKFGTELLIILQAFTNSFPKSELLNSNLRKIQMEKAKFGSMSQISNTTLNSKFGIYIKIEENQINVKSYFLKQKENECLWKKDDGIY